MPLLIGSTSTLRALEMPSPELLASLAAESSPKTKILLREGVIVDIQVEGNPPRDQERFRRQVVSTLSGQLTKLGAKPGAGGPVKLVASFQERDTGVMLELIKMGGDPKNPEKRIIPERELTCRITLSDGTGSPIVLFEQKTSSRIFGIRGFPAGENDWEGFLRNDHWLNVARSMSAVQLPYFVGRTAGSTAVLPGFTSLGFPMP